MHTQTGCNSDLGAVADLQLLPGHQDEEDEQGGVDEDGYGQHHESALSEELADVRFADTREVEGRVLAQSE